MGQDTPNEPRTQIDNLAGDDTSLDLPVGMFRSGEVVETTTMMMPRLLTGLENVQAKFTEVDGMALFEGDIILGPADDARTGDSAAKGIGIAGAEYRWPDGVIPYVTEQSLLAVVQVAITHWEERTPIRFVKRTSEKDYVSFEKRKGCWSRVGHQGGEQVISLGDGCGLGAAIHEIGHALGLWHEQSRSDRDQHIEVILENVVPEHRHNFDKHIQDGDDLGDYDFTSIMHYPATAFSRNGQPTIRVRGGQPIGQRSGLSRGDVLAIKMLYPNLNWKRSV